MDCFQTVKTIKRWNHLSRKMVSLWKGWTAFCRGQSRDFPLPQQGRGHFKALSPKSGLQRAPEGLEKGSFARFLLPSPGQDLEKQEGKKKKKNPSGMLTSQIANEVLQHHLPVRLDVGAVHVRVEEDDRKGQDEDGVWVVKLLDHIWITHAVPLAAAGGMHILNIEHWSPLLKGSNDFLMHGSNSSFHSSSHTNEKELLALWRPIYHQQLKLATKTSAFLFSEAKRANNSR